MTIFGTYFISALALIAMRLYHVIEWSWFLVVAVVLVPPALGFLFVALMVRAAIAEIERDPGKFISDLRED